MSTNIDNIKKYSLGIEEIMDFVLLVSSIVTIGAFLIALIKDNTNPVFIYINLITGFIALSIYGFRSRIPREIKGFFLVLAGIINSSFSFFTNSTIGTGVLVIVVIQIVILVTIEGKRAIFISSLGLLPLILALVFINEGILSFGDEIKVRVNSSGTWLITLITSFSVYVIIVYSIKSLKNKLFIQIETIEKLSNLDGLTGFANKNYFINLVEKSLFYHIKQKKDERIFLYLVRLENFRLIDSMYGHSKGDLVIKEIADSLPHIVPEGAIFGRYSGSEFSVFSRASGKDVLDSLEAHLDRMFPEMSLPISIIQVAYPVGGKTIGELLSNLEITVKVGKENSIEKFTEFNPVFLRDLTLEKDMLYLLQRAVRNREFSVAYQNKVKTHSGLIHGVEALARWNSREMGSVSPDKFIPVLHKYNLMVDFSMVILDRILSEYHILENNLGHGVKVSINISPTLFLFPAFQRYILYTLKEYGVDPNVVVLEITEEILMNELGEVSRIVKELKDVGIEVALDDFGKGFSSLNYLQFVDFSEIKIDKSFVDNIVDDPKSRSLISAICRIGKDLHMRIVCEGVETRDQMEILKELNCDLIQGFLFSRPYSVRKE